MRLAMASRYEEIPLFPLNTVLFPYGQLQLHIFEEKYRLMVRECLEYDRPFGVALIRAGSDLGEPHLIGTAARITEARHDDDGHGCCDPLPVHGASSTVTPHRTTNTPEGVRHL